MFIPHLGICEQSFSNLTSIVHITTTLHAFLLSIQCTRSKCGACSTIVDKGGPTFGSAGCCSLIYIIFNSTIHLRSMACFVTAFVQAPDDSSFWGPRFKYFIQLCGLRFSLSLLLFAHCTGLRTLMQPVMPIGLTEVLLTPTWIAAAQAEQASGARQKTYVFVLWLS